MAAAVPPFMFIEQPGEQQPLLSDSHHSFTFQVVYVLLLPGYIHGCFHIANRETQLPYFLHLNQRTLNTKQNVHYRATHENGSHATLERQITVHDLRTCRGGGTILFRGKVIWLQSERRARGGGRPRPPGWLLARPSFPSSVRPSAPLSNTPLPMRAFILRSAEEKS